MHGFGSAIPRVRHSGCQPFGDGSVVRRVSGLKGHLSESFYSVNVLALSVYSGDINLVNFGPKTVNQKPKIGEFGTPKV